MHLTVSVDDPALETLRQSRGRVPTVHSGGQHSPIAPAGDIISQPTDSWVGAELGFIIYFLYFWMIFFPDVLGMTQQGTSLWCPSAAAAGHAEPGFVLRDQRHPAAGCGHHRLRFRGSDHHRPATAAGPSGAWVGSGGPVLHHVAAPLDPRPA